MRRIAVNKNDTLVMDGYEIDASILDSIINPQARVLWAFVKNEEDHAICPIAYSEDHVIWLQDSDLQRADTEA